MKVTSTHVYAFLYLLAIPVFAVIYSHLPQDFYHSTIQYEEEFKQYKERILNLFATEMIAAFEKEQGAKVIKKKLGDITWDVHINTLSLGVLKLTDDRPSFEMGLVVGVLHENPKGDIDGYENFRLHYDVSILGAKMRSAQGQEIDLKFATVKHLFDPSGLASAISLDLPIINLFQTYNIVATRPANEPYIRSVLLDISPELSHLFDGFSSEAQGLPAKVTGSYVRMLYFSVATITTLGFGDIVPITDTARLWVAVEGIWGIVFIGSFINSLFNIREKAKL